MPAYLGLQGPLRFLQTAHVDTPRGPTQFGSLVLCLPVAHKGGHLSVRHASLDPVVYEWDTAEGSDSLQWAAFYSDCEHEVHEVTEGVRLTITYNLYCDPREQAETPVLADIHRNPAPVNIAKFAPYTVLKNLLDNPAWMTDGAQIILSSFPLPHVILDF